MIVLDTNVILDYFNEKLSKPVERRLIDVFSSRQYCISIITRMETRIGIEKSTDPEMVEHFLQAATCIEIWPEIETEAVRIRKQTGIKLPDAIIAATAYFLGATLATNDAKGFGRVLGLDVWAPERVG